MSGPPQPSGTRIETLLTEIVEIVASHLDDRSLLTLSILSRTINSKSYYTYGERFFTMLKFCIYPNSLQRLTDISNALELANHVRNVAFDIFLPAVIDPVQELIVKGSVQFHSKPTIDHLPVEEKFCIRLGIDPLIIVSALSKFPKLQHVVISNQLRLNGKDVRETYGRSRLTPSDCPIRHCLQFGRCNIECVFNTIALAMEQFDVSKDVHVTVAIGMNDQEYMQFIDHPFGGPTGNFLHSINQLQLNLNLRDCDFMQKHVARFAKSFDLQILDVTYNPSLSTSPARPFYTTNIGLELLPLQHLCQITLEDLWTEAAALAAFLHTHADRLTHVSLKNCSVENAISFAQNSRAGTWDAVIQEISNLHRLTFLNLERLVSNQVVNHISSKIRDQDRHRALSRDLSLLAPWKGEHEIKVGLKYLATTHRI